MAVDYRIITSREELAREIVQVQPDDVVAVDTETNQLDPSKPTSRLLGVSVSTERLATLKAFYVPLFQYEHATGRFNLNVEVGLISLLTSFLSSLTNAVGHNYTFDFEWLRRHLEVNMNFTFDTQILWHLSSATFNKTSWNLKRAQRDVLGWESGDVALQASVEKNGGKWNDETKEMYKADLEDLGFYAAKDAHATLLLFQHCKPFFDRNDYWEFAKSIQEYKELLVTNTKAGILVDRDALQTLHEKFSTQLAQLDSETRELIAEPAKKIEEEMFAKQLAYYKDPDGYYAREFKNSPERHPKFNFSSDKHLATLLYDKLGFPVTERTKTGQPKTNKLALKQIDHPVAKNLVAMSRIETLVNTFTTSYLGASRDGSYIYPGFNITGTVSGRLSGFKPNMQQAPFKELELMKCFPAPPGKVGIHMDLVSIEPFFTAYFSEDPFLLKIYLEGKGDIYLDLAQKLFPGNEELQTVYDTNAAPTSEIKKKFGKERDVGKPIHLSSQYGAGGKKIATILTQNGYPTTEAEGRKINKIYWSLFAGVKRLEKALYEVYRTDGKVTNPFGRIVTLPESYCKDLLNRFIQGTASDCLKAIVMEIAKINSTRQLGMLPWLIDVHDATNWLIDENRAEEGKAVFAEALANINQRLGLEFPVRGEIRVIHSFADIKGN